MTKIRIAGTLPFSLVNGYGIRYVVFVQGCSHHCDGCQNPGTWDFNGGYEVSVKDLVEDISKRKHIDGVTLSGGDPFFQQDVCVAFLKLLPKYLNIWIYTGFKYEDIKDTTLAKMADYIVDGKFDKKKIVAGEMFGSSNQRIIKVKDTVDG